MFLLDTNVVSELRRPHRTDPKVAAWADSESPADMFISSITILELATGALLLRRRDVRQGSLIQQWVEDRVLPAFAERILPVDTAVARRCALLHVPDPPALSGFADRRHRPDPSAHRRDPEPGRVRADVRSRAQPVGMIDASDRIERQQAGPLVVATHSAPLRHT
jgi:predicted nucleic acid-binding protein